MTRILRNLPRLLIVLAAGVAAACGSAADDGEAARGYTDIGVEELHDMLDGGEDPVLVNVHVPHQGDIEGTDARIPFDEIGERLDEIPGGKDARIVLYCRSGNMSRDAAETLVEAGYLDVYNLEGGRRAWQAAGY